MVIDIDLEVVPLDDRGERGELLLRWLATFGNQHRGYALSVRERKEALPMIGREPTKEQLYHPAKRLGIKGRSKMSKNQLKAAVGRHR